MRRRQLHIIKVLAFLLGSVALTGCIDVVEEENFPVEEGEAKVDLSLSLDAEYSEVGKDSRMTAENVQNGNQFRGVNQLKFFAMTAPVTANGFGGDGQSQYNFTPITINTVNFTQNKGGTERALFQQEVALPIGINRFVGFGSVNRPFGKVDKSVNQDELFDKGVLLSHWNLDPGVDHKAKKLNDFYFGPRTIFSQTMNSAENTDACCMLRWINRVLSVKAEVNGNQLNWPETVIQYSTDGATEYTILKTTLEECTGNKAGAYRNIKSLMESLYHQLKDVAEGNSRYNALAIAIRGRILKPAEIPDAGTEDYPDLLTFTVKEAKNKAVLNLVSPKDFDFPKALNIPAGAATLIFKTGDNGGEGWNNDALSAAFPYARYNDNDNSGNVGLPVYAYAYPAELLYRVDSPICTSKQVKGDGWANASGSWTDFLNGYEGERKLVANTQSIALEEPFHYMVGCLETRAYIDANPAAPQLPDRNTTAAGDKLITIKTEGFPITGILVGMQSYVGWNGKQRQLPSNEVEGQYIYYDCHLNGTQPMYVKVMNQPTADQIEQLPVISYTLALESMVANLAELKDNALGPGEGNKTKQMILLELENNTGKDFHGHEKQVIAPGTKFYLMGELNLHTEYLAHPELFADPNKSYSVFQQGVTTKATLRIHSLAGAYNSIPDLRNPSLKISLKTDWNWKNGVIYEDNIPLSNP